MDFGFAFLGLIILVLAGDLLVRGAVNLSLRLGIPALLVSLTIVALGTSAPELLIAVRAVMENAPGIAIGNVIGSNTANVLLVLGLPALFKGLNTSQCDTRKSYSQMLAATLLFVIVMFLAPINSMHAVALLGLYFAIMVYTIYQAKCQRQSKAALASDADIYDDGGMATWRIALLIIAGLIGLPLGADLLVDAATNIARAYSISETVIGLTLVAVGTSLPELATTISAAFRRQADVAIGNVIGSNIANLLAITGTAALFGSIPVTQQVLHFDLWVMVAASLMLLPFVYFKMDISRRWGALLSGLYFAYVISVLL